MLSRRLFTQVLASSPITIQRVLYDYRPVVYWEDSNQIYWQNEGKVRRCAFVPKLLSDYDKNAILNWFGAKECELFEKEADYNGYVILNKMQGSPSGFVMMQNIPNPWSYLEINEIVKKGISNLIHMGLT